MNVTIEKICNDNITEKYLTEELLERRSLAAFSGYVHRVEAIKSWDFWGVLDDENPIGFFCGSNSNNIGTSDIARLMEYSILPKYKDKGIEILAYKELEKYYRQMNCSYFYAAVNDDFVDEDSEKKKIFKEMGFKELCSTSDFEHDNEDQERYWSIMVKKI